MSWIVKLKRTGFETVLAGPGEKGKITLIADELNERYQTDEYKVEEWRPDLYPSFALPGKKRRV